MCSDALGAAVSVNDDVRPWGSGDLDPQSRCSSLPPAFPSETARAERYKSGYSLLSNPSCFIACCISSVVRKHCASTALGPCSPLPSNSRNASPAKRSEGASQPHHSSDLSHSPPPASRETAATTGPKIEGTAGSETELTTGDDWGGLSRRSSRRALCSTRLTPPSSEPSSLLRCSTCERQSATPLWSRAYMDVQLRVCMVS